MLFNTASSPAPVSEDAEMKPGPMDCYDFGIDMETDTLITCLDLILYSARSHPRLDLIPSTYKVAWI